jgi:hypothetical protein
MEAVSGNGSRTYWRYALGETLLIVVGILLALQINNWNEERIEQNAIREFALNLSDAIKADMEMLGPVEMQIKATMRQSEELANYLRDRSVEEMSNLELFFLTNITGYRPYGWNRAALEQLKASGGLRQMKNTRMSRYISDYDALTQHLDQDYQEDEESARAIWRLVNELIDQNYPLKGLYELLEWEDGFTDEYIERRLTGLRETEVFRKLAELQRPLLSQDLAQFRQLANLNRDYAEAIRPRTEIELPRLREFAREIQSLIDEEYR